MIWSFYTSSKQEYRAQKDDPLVSVSNLDIFTYGVSFPQVTFCSEYFYDPGMDPSWFKTANATVYRDWQEDDYQSEQLKVSFVDPGPYLSYASGICVQVESTPIESIYDWVRVELEFKPILRNYFHGTCNDTHLSCVMSHFEHMGLEFITFLEIPGSDWEKAELFTPFTWKDSFWTFKFYREEYLNKPDLATIATTTQVSDILRSYSYSNSTFLSFDDTESFVMRLWMTSPNPTIHRTKEVAPRRLTLFAIATTVYAIFGTVYSIFNGLAHHAPPAKRRFLPRFRTGRQAIVHDVHDILEHRVSHGRKSEGKEQELPPVPQRTEAC